MILLGRWRQYQFCPLHGGIEGPKMMLDASGCSTLAYLGVLMVVIRGRELWTRVGVLMVVIYISSSRLWLWQIQKQCRKAVCLIQAHVSLEWRVIARSWDNRWHRIHGQETGSCKLMIKIDHCNTQDKIHGQIFSWNPVGGVSLSLSLCRDKLKCGVIIDYY